MPFFPSFAARRLNQKLANEVERKSCWEMSRDFGGGRVPFALFFNRNTFLIPIEKETFFFPFVYSFYYSISSAELPITRSALTDQKNRIPYYQSIWPRVGITNDFSNFFCVPSSSIFTLFFFYFETKDKYRVSVRPKEMYFRVCGPGGGREGVPCHSRPSSLFYRPLFFPVRH